MWVLCRACKSGASRRSSRLKAKVKNRQLRLMEGDETSEERTRDHRHLQRVRGRGHDGSRISHSVNRQAIAKKTRTHEFCREHGSERIGRYEDWSRRSKEGSGQAKSERERESDEPFATAARDLTNLARQPCSPWVPAEGRVQGWISRMHFRLD